MFDFTETTLINAPASAVWDVMTDLDGWWVASNPEHISLDRLDDDGISVGARIRIRERIAGIPGDYIGELTHVDVGRRVTMEASHARYRLLGIALTVSEGVTWRIESIAPSTTELSAHVWASFPPNRLGRGLEFVFTRLIDGVAKDRKHARAELNYLKHRIEGSQPKPAS